MTVLLFIKGSTKEFHSHDNQKKKKTNRKIIYKLHFRFKSVTSLGRVVKQKQVTFSQSAEQPVIICSVLLAGSG